MKKNTVEIITPIFVLHGVSGKLNSIRAFVDNLKRDAMTNITILSYPIYDSFYDCVTHISNEIEKHTNKETEIIVIGQSYGGVVANSLHKRGWNIKKGIYVCSPLNGNWLLKKLDNWLPNWIVKRLDRKSYMHLRIKDKETEPNHDYNTITTGRFGLSFDGQVYTDEVILNKENNVHISGSDHWRLFYDRRLSSMIYKLLQ